MRGRALPGTFWSCSRAAVRVKLSLRSKLLTAVLLYLILLVCVGLLGLYAAQDSVDRLHVAVEHHFREVNLLSELTSVASQSRATSLLHTLSSSPAEWERYEADIAQLEQQADALTQQFVQTQAAFGDQDDIEDIGAFSRAWQDFVEVRDGEFLPLSRANRDEEALELARPGGRLDQAYRGARTKLRGLHTALETLSGQQLAQTEDVFGRNRNMLFAALVLAGCFGVAFGLLQSARLARAVQAVSRAAARVADGDFSQRVEVRTGDEIESLANSFNVMTASLHHMTETLRESEARFRSVTESVNEGIISVDSTGRIVFWNRGAQAIFGYAEDEILGQPLFLLVPERHRDSLQAVLDRASSPGAVGPTGGAQDWFGLRKDRTEFPLEVSLATWTKGNEVFFSGVVRDATERRAMERMKNEFIAMVSHELRTPMHSVIGMTDLLLRTELGLEQRDYVEALQRSGGVLLGLINDILDLSKIEAGKLDLEITDFDLSEVVEEAAEVVAEQARSKDLEIICDIQPDLPRAVRGDPGRLRQVLLNLVTNAVKFTTSGEVVVRSRLIEEADDSVVVRFEIADTGVGIRPDAQRLLFRPFQQLDASARRTGGTGLGLAISRRLVELMGGEVGAESAPGKGSTFWFAVPFEKQADASASPPMGDPGMPGARVLVMDASATSRAALARQLEAWNLLVACEAEPTRVLDRLRAAAHEESPYRWAILGARTTTTGILDLAWTIKSDADPVVAATRLILLGQPGRTQAGNELRASGLVRLPKPVSRARLLDALTASATTTSGPRQPASRAAIGSEALAAASLPPAPAGPRVLVVEDSAMGRHVALRMLRSLGYRPEIVEDGHAAVRALSHETYAAVLMDCQLPDLDGCDVTAEVRRRESPGQRTPIIAITASAMKGDRERCFAAGMNDYLAKPIRFNDLAGVLARWAPLAPPAASERPPSARLAPPSVSASSSPIDDSALASLRQYQQPGEEDLAATAVRHFRTSAARLLVVAREAADRHDAEALWRAAHNLRADGATIGAREMEAVCAALERLGRAGTTLGARELCAVLDDALERATAQLEQLVWGAVA